MSSLIAAPIAAADPGDTATYTANSDAPLSLVTYYDGNNIHINVNRSIREQKSYPERDKKLRTKPVEVRALWESELRVFCIGGKRDLSTWEWLARRVKHWPRMEELIDRRGPGLWIYMVNESTVDEYVPTWATRQPPP